MLLSLFSDSDRLHRDVSNTAINYIDRYINVANLAKMAKEKNVRNHKN